MDEEHKEGGNTMWAAFRLTEETPLSACGFAASVRGLAVAAIPDSCKRENRDPSLPDAPRLWSPI